jgi:hypothetical protein
MTSSPRLLFVYNADNGLLNALKDSIHKLRSPETYECSLCAVTYGPLAMRPEWKAYLKRLPHETIFLHRDEWRKAHPGLDEPLPAIFLQRDGEPPRTLVRAGEMPLGQSLDQLMTLLDRRLAANAR